MIQFAGQTYRLVEVTQAVYLVVRIADGTELGFFRLGPPLQLWGCSTTTTELAAVARCAIRQGKTTWQRNERGPSRLKAHAALLLAMILGLASCSGSPRPNASTTTTALT